VRIAIDARMIAHSGIGSSVRGLLHGLAAIDAPHTYVVFAGVRGRTQIPESERFEIRAAEVPIYSLAEHLRMPARFRAARCDVVHVPHYDLPIGTPAPCVVTVHDLLHLRRPGLLRGPLQATTAGFLLRHAVARADAILAVSETTRDELIRVLGVEPERIRVIPNGLDPSYRPPESARIEALRGRLELPPRFLLYVGLLRPHKNIVRMVEAFERAARVAGPLALVLRGRPEARYREVLSAIEVARRSADIRLLDEHVAAGDMPCLYAAASAYVQPSLHEGFGLPPLEAIACGVPVLAADAGALPEVLGDAALFVEPLDTGAIAAGMVRILTDSTLRSELMARGRKRIEHFDWRSSARATLAVYEQVARG